MDLAYANTTFPTVRDTTAEELIRRLPSNESEEITAQERRQQIEEKLARRGISSEK